MSKTNKGNKTKVRKDVLCLGLVITMGKTSTE